MKRVSGFTFIELAVTITIIGILAAVAIPRYLNMQGQAQSASIQSAYGAIQSASALTHAAYLAVGASTATSVSLDGTSVTTTAHRLLQQPGLPTAQPLAHTSSQGLAWDQP